MNLSIWIWHWKRVLTFLLYIYSRHFLFLLFCNWIQCIIIIAISNRNRNSLMMKQQWKNFRDAWKLKDPSDESPSLFNIIRMHLVTICAWTHTKTHTHTHQRVLHNMQKKVFVLSSLGNFKWKSSKEHMTCKKFVDRFEWAVFIQSFEFRCATLTQNAIFCASIAPKSHLRSRIQSSNLRHGHTRTHTQILHSVLTSTE